MPLEGPSVDGDVGPAVNAFTPDDQVRRRSVRYGPFNRPAPTLEFPRDTAKAPAKAVQPARLGVTGLALLWSEQVPLAPRTCSVAVGVGHCTSNCGTTMPSCMRTIENSGLHARSVGSAPNATRYRCTSARMPAVSNVSSASFGCLCTSWRRPRSRGLGARRPTAPARHRVDQRPCVVGPATPRRLHRGTTARDNTGSSEGSKPCAVSGNSSTRATWTRCRQTWRSGRHRVARYRGGPWRGRQGASRRVCAKALQSDPNTYAPTWRASSTCTWPSSSTYCLRLPGDSLINTGM